jgi:hypothetical protein
MKPKPPHTSYRRQKTSEFIVKVQRPLSSNIPNPPMLVYNEERTLMESMNNPDIRRAMGDEPKQYWWVHLRGGTLYFLRPAPEQEW